MCDSDSVPLCPDPPLLVHSGKDRLTLVWGERSELLQSLLLSRLSRGSRASEDALEDGNVEIDASAKSGGAEGGIGSGSVESGVASRVSAAVGSTEQSTIAAGVGVGVDVDVDGGSAADEAECQTDSDLDGAALTYELQMWPIAEFGAAAHAHSPSEGPVPGEKEKKPTEPPGGPRSSKGTKAKKGKRTPTPSPTPHATDVGNSTLVSSAEPRTVYLGTRKYAVIDSLALATSYCFRLQVRMLSRCIYLVRWHPSLCS